MYARRVEDEKQERQRPFFLKGERAKSERSTSNVQHPMERREEVPRSSASRHSSARPEEEGERQDRQGREEFEAFPIFAVLAPLA